MSARDEMLELLRTRRHGFSLPQRFYRDPAFYQLDLDCIFGRVWLFAGLACEIPERGDWFTLPVGDSSIVVVRDRQGEVRAFHNTCRHRGARICLAERGRASRLVCPYHQWTYDLDGRLVGARHMEPDFDKRPYALKPVHVGLVGGYVFVCLADQAPDFEAFRRDVEPYMLPHDLENAKVAHVESIVERGNWKLVMENNRECYHCQGSHPELIRTLAEFDNDQDPRTSAEYKELLQVARQRWASLGLPSVETLSADYRAIRLPFIGGARSMTLSGEPASARLMGKVPDGDLGSMRLLHLPNTWNHMQGDHCIAFRILPVGPEETLLTTKWLVHKDAVEGVDYEVENLTHVWRRTNEQDRRVVEINQQGINSRAYEPGPYSRQSEFGVIHFVEWYCAEIERQLMGAGTGAGEGAALAAE
ncbi:MAG TPA: aromatic ring-hydroxylating dioxygenase subunit alpha [Geminicoccaceae bacterium]|nr:aromatic ring-hydroxylating dioxygenase subunit alpha [Geminicoccaceae bacterium]